MSERDYDESLVHRDGSVLTKAHRAVSADRGETQYDLRVRLSIRVQKTCVYRRLTILESADHEVIRDALLQRREVDAWKVYTESMSPMIDSDVWVVWVGYRRPQDEVDLMLGSGRFGMDLTRMPGHVGLPADSELVVMVQTAYPRILELHGFFTPL